MDHVMILKLRTEYMTLPIEAIVTPFTLVAIAKMST